MSSFLALPWYGAGDVPDDEPLVVCGTCAMGQRVVQNCGRAFWDRFESPLQDRSPKKGGSKSKDEAADKQDSAEADREKAYREKREKRQRESKGKDGGLLKMSDDLKGRDLYELLEIEPGASAEDVKKSYRKLVLVHHPDKMTDPTEEQKKHFLLIQEAFEVISDPDKKRRYESMLDFDDAIPSSFPNGPYKGMDFYEVFRPVFKNNARWSARPKVPSLGDENTDIEAVKEFYEFWYSFESWRDPLAMAEKDDYELHCLDEAECREERRWMERENAKVAKRLAAAERERISDLVKVAERNDPRMIAYKEKLRQEKEAEKARKAAAIQAEKDKKDAEARARREMEEAKRREEEAKRQEERRVREEQKAVLKRARQRLRNLHKNADVIVRRSVHVEQLQQVCLRLEVEELDSLCDEIEAAFKQDGEEYPTVIGLFRDEIVKCGATPIFDNSVGSGASTISPEDSNEDGEASDDDDRSPAKPVRELTPEELEAERLRKLAEEAAEAERAARKAEEQRKKREAAKKEEEKRQAELRKQEKKERERLAKEKAKEEKKQEQAAKQLEEQRIKQQQQREQQREAALAEEAERKRLHEEQLVMRAFETDRLKRIAILEAYEGNMLEQALEGTLLQEGSDQPNAQLKLALRQLAAQTPAPAASKETAAAREVEELCVDLAVACLSTEGGAGAAPDEARARLAGALAVAVRPTRGQPELSKEAKATMKKVRTRARAAVLALLRKLGSVEPVRVAKPRPAGTAAPPRDTIANGVELYVAEDGPVFESATSYDEIGSMSVGAVVVASGPAVEVEGYPMVPIRPKGTLELRILRALAAPESPTKSSKGQGSSGKKASEPALDGKLKEFVRLAATNVDIAELELRGACYHTFDPAAAIAAADVPAAAAPEATVAAAGDESPAGATKSGKKKGGKKAEAEDLDSLLEEFGMTSQASPKSGKKKNKK
mmetsp:Transcript_123586/g.357409  ORF Transcript_123586/g.357409 Transcript_123586/m.357409 type:complete len:951 (+) Transcript_123586:93-2945(+)